MRLWVMRKNLKGKSALIKYIKYGMSYRAKVIFRRVAIKTGP